jgi:hypothetical protein
MATACPVPFDAINQFRQLGAVRWSVLVHAQPYFSSGTYHLVEWPYLVHFWDEQGREIGYWNAPCDSAHIFAPDYRQWHRDFLADQNFYEMPAEL